MPTHRSHPRHDLVLTDRKTVYTCNGCKMDGYGERYRCNHCNYDLHKECMNPKEAIALETLFPGTTFNFMTRPAKASKSGRACDVCGMTVKGFCYHDKAGGLDVHPLCALLKPEILVDDVEFRLRKGTGSRCNWCKEKKLKGTVDKVPGFCYVSACGDYSFHVYCLLAMGLECGSNDDDDYNRLGRDVAVPELRMERNIPGLGGRTKFVKVVKLFLKVVLSVLFGDPTAIVASVLVELIPRLLG